MLIFSKYTHLISIEKNIFCLYHSFTQKKLYLFSNKFKKGQNLINLNIESLHLNHSLLALLKKHRFVIDNYKKEERQLKLFRKKWRPTLSQLYLVVSEACNFRCKYCRQYCHNNLIKPRLMDFHQAKEVIDWFLKSMPRARGIVFYGGEPMLNAPVIIKCLEYIQAKYKKYIAKSNFDCTLITNGTLISDEIAQKLAKYNVYIVVSIDGPAVVHDTFRVYSSGQKVFKDVLRGYQTYQRNGCRVGISCTIGKHNLKKISQVLNYFKKELIPLNVGVNLPHGDETNILLSNINRKNLIKNLSAMLYKYNCQGLYIEHIMRKLLLLFREEIKINDCPACGGRIVVLPGKRIGVCEGAIGMKKFFQPWSKMPVLKKSAWQWFMTSPLFVKECQNCLVLGVCGGGCPLDGYFKQRQLGGRDSLRCDFLKEIIQWGLKDFYYFFGKKLDNGGKALQYFIPTLNMQNKFLHHLGAVKKELPLRSSARYSINNYSKLPT